MTEATATTGYAGSASAGRPSSPTSSSITTQEPGRSPSPYSTRSHATLVNQARRKEFFDNYDTLHRNYLKALMGSRGDLDERPQSSLDGQQAVSSSKATNGAKTMQELSTVQVYRKRYAIIVLFCLYSMINSFQWIEYSILNGALSQYYHVDHMAINWTSTIYMVVYIPLIIPTSWLMRSIGLRNSIIVGSVGTSLGSLIKCFSVSETHFWLTMIGQTVVAISQLFIISVPPRLAAVWFPDNQVSTATAWGVFGNQLGIALGFVVPPLLVPQTSNTEQVAHGLHLLFNSVAGVSCLITLAILMFLDDRPPKPPGIARLEQLKLENTEKISSSAVTDFNTSGSPSSATGESRQPTFLSSISSLFCQFNFMLLFISYGLNVGSFYAISTVLNQMLSKLHWIEHAASLGGFMGLAMTLTGMLGSLFCGYVLDKTHAFKAITQLVYLMTIVAIATFAVVIRVGRLDQDEWALYASSAFLGFFMVGYLPIGFEFGSEITYPHSEDISAGLLNMSAQAFGIALTFVTSFLVDGYNDMYANIFLGGCLFVGLLLSCCIRADMRRQRAIRSLP